VQKQRDAKQVLQKMKQTGQTAKRTEGKEKGTEANCTAEKKPEALGVEPACVRVPSKAGTGQGRRLSVRLHLDSEADFMIEACESDVLHAVVCSSLELERSDVASINLAGEVVCVGDTFADWGADDGITVCVHIRQVNRLRQRAYREHAPEEDDFPVLLLGDAAVGKTTMIGKLEKMICTEGGTDPTMWDWTDEDEYYDQFDFKFPNIECQMEHRDFGCTLVLIWEMASADRYDTVRQLAYKDLLGKCPTGGLTLLCYDVINRCSFARCQSAWLVELRENSAFEEDERPVYLEAGDYVPAAPWIILLGMKADKATPGSERVTTKEGLQMAKSIGASAFIEVSSKTGQGFGKLRALLMELMCCQLEGQERPSEPLMEPQFLPHDDNWFPW